MIQIIFCSFKRLFRNTTNMFWILIFPIVLGTFFYIAFSNLGASESMSTIPVAVVLTDDYYGEALKQTVTFRRRRSFSGHYLLFRRGSTKASGKRRCMRYDPEW